MSLNRVRKKGIVGTLLVLNAFQITTTANEANNGFNSKWQGGGAGRETISEQYECRPGNESGKCGNDSSDELLLKSIAELYGNWSVWSSCFETGNGTKIRIRERTCKVPFVCHNMVMREEDDCFSPSRHEKTNATWQHLRVQYENENCFYVVTDTKKKFIKRIGINLVPYLEKNAGSKRKKRIYSRWSRWTICTKSCMTQRYRWCKKVEYCGNEVIRQTAFCYTEGSQCESWIMDNMPQQLAQEGNTVAQGPDELYQTTTPTVTIANNEVRSDEMEQMEPTASCGVLYGNVTLSRGPSVEHMLRIIGGRPSRRGKWPWIVSVLNRFKESICGGTLVSSQWVLTAAHCVKRRMYVTIGEHNLAVKDDKEIRLRVRKAIIHPDYDPTTVNNDVALLKLPKVKSVDLQSRIVCLPQPWQPLPAHQLCTILGWGKRGNADSYGTNVLHEAQVPIVSASTCSKVYEPEIVTSNMFCAGYRKGRRDTCSGDSGGPLLCGDEMDRWTVFGITSFGEGCGKKGKYGIYTRLPNYVRWIQSVIGV